MTTATPITGMEHVTVTVRFLDDDLLDYREETIRCSVCGGKVVCQTREHERQDWIRRTRYDFIRAHAGCKPGGDKENVR